MTKFETYFFEKLAIETNIDDCYFAMPSNDCFTYLIKEIRHLIQLQEENELHPGYIIDISRWFLSFMEEDTVLETIDSIDYANLIFLLKKISEGCPINRKETISLLKRMQDKNSYSYFKKVADNILELNSLEKFDFKKASILTELFLNECLARNIDIRFISKTILWYKSECFKSFKDFLYYFINMDSDSYDVLLPINGFSDEDKSIFDHHEQKIVDLEGEKYLQIYKNNTIDFYSLITGNMMRIESIFNMLKLYTSSTISFDFSKDVIVLFNKTTKLKNMKDFKFPFKSIMTYSGVKPYSKYMHATIDNLFFVENENKNSYHKILNVISYSEKDNDFINPTAYVDAWIALETLYSLSEHGKGLDVVKNYLPYFVSSKILMNKLQFYLKNGCVKPCNAENFILKKCLIKPISEYFNYEIEKFDSRFGDFKELSKYYSKIESRIKIDLIRIYMLRNEYVHQSNLNAFSSLQFYKLRNYLTLSLDIFFAMIDKTKSYSSNQGNNLIYFVFDRLIQKNNNRITAFKIETESHKINNKNKTLRLLELNNPSFSTRKLALNIVLNNNTVNKPFVKYDDKIDV